MINIAGESAQFPAQRSSLARVSAATLVSSPLTRRLLEFESLTPRCCVERNSRLKRVVTIL